MAGSKKRPGKTGPGRRELARKPKYVFAVPPKKPVAREPKPKYVFAVPPAVPTLREVLEGPAPGEGFGLPPREVCDECGARPAQRHAPDCSYAGYPTLIQDPDFRLSMAAELKLSKMRCSVCRCPVLFEVEYDRTQHKWWCTWWDAHPDVPPPF